LAGRFSEQEGVFYGSGGTEAGESGIELFLKEAGDILRTVVGLPKKTEKLLGRMEQGKLDVRVPELRERIARLDEQTAFKNLAKSNKRNPEERAVEEALGRKQQDSIRSLLARMPDTLFKDRVLFEKALDIITRPS
jgi:hypothetical protein